VARRDTRKPTRCGTVPGLMSSCRRKIAVWARRVARTLWSALIATTAWRLPSGLEVYTQQSGRSIGPRIRSLHEEFLESRSNSRPAARPTAKPSSSPSTFFVPCSPHVHNVGTASTESWLTIW
jgi:hypothetical protein